MRRYGVFCVFLFYFIFFYVPPFCKSNFDTRKVRKRERGQSQSESEAKKRMQPRRATRVTRKVQDVLDDADDADGDGNKRAEQVPAGQMPRLLELILESPVK